MLSLRSIRLALWDRFGAQVETRFGGKSGTNIARAQVGVGSVFLRGLRLDQDPAHSQ